MACIVLLTEGRLDRWIDDGGWLICFQGMDMTKLMVPGQRLYNLPFDVVLHNNIALSYFLGMRRPLCYSFHFSDFHFVCVTFLVLDSGFNCDRSNR